jgi:hypothetical protein
MSVLSVCHGAISGAMPVSSHCHPTRSVYDIITARIVAELERGVVPVPVVAQAA